ncbi:methyltransferase-like protein 17, mitochondrial [Sergentomyia squamirostris]
MRIRLTPRFFTQISKLSTRPSVILEENVSKSLEKTEYKPRKHPGVVHEKLIKIPEFLDDVVPKVIRDYPIASVCLDAESLDRYLWSRHPPPTTEEVKSKQEKFRAMYIEKGKLNFAEMTEVQKQKAEAALFQKVQKRVKKEVYSWKNLQYDEYSALQYLMGRSPAEYAALHRILSEIRVRDQAFTPNSYFDFGSGVGSSLWATISVFPKEKIFEYFMVDTSSAMNDLSEMILRRGNPDGDAMIRNFYYRQFLPASSTNTYDLVISAYTLFELTSQDVRLQTLKSLWTKTEKYLVLVERGTLAGFNLITEARDFILKIDPETSQVFAPCPHEFSCPRLADGTPCNFEVKFENLRAFRKNNIQKEIFSYVVLKKRPRDLSRSEESWPRIVRPVLVRKKHSICRLCTMEGKLQEIIFTAAKHGKMTYHCARKSNWGDRLPISIQNPEKSSPELSDEEIEAEK